MDRYKQLKIELPTPSRLERLAHSALQMVDGQFFTTLAQALSPETRALLDAMLTETSARDGSRGVLRIMACSGSARIGTTTGPGCGL